MGIEFFVKILQVTPYLDPKGGGQERHVLALAKTLSSFGHKVTILTCGSYPQSVAQGFDIIKIRSVNLLGLRIISMKDLIRLLTRSRFDVCHLHHQTLLGEIVLLGNKIRGLPTITTLHTTMLRTTPAKFFYDRVSLRFISALSSKVICLSPNIMNDLVKRGLKRSKCVVIPNALDVQSLKDEFHKIGKELKGPKFDILFVGRLEKRKGIHWLLKSLLLLHKEGKKYTLRIVGHGPLERELSKVASANNLSLYVKLLGYVPQKELLKCFLLSKVVVVPSSFEGIPTVALEAMVAGKPLIVSNIPGLNELIVNEGNGLVVTLMNTQELASAIDKVLASANRLSSLNEVNEKILAELDWKVVANKIANTYFEATGRAFSPHDVKSGNRFELLRKQLNA